MRFGTRKAFLRDMTKTLQGPINATLGTLGVPSSSASPSAASPSAPAIAISESVAEMQSVKYQLKKFGVEPGKYVLKKAVDRDDEDDEDDDDEEEDDDAKKPSKIYRVLSVSEGGEVTMQITSTYEPDDDEHITVEGNDVFAKWRVHRGAVKSKMVGWSAGEPCPLDLITFGFDALRGAIFVAMHDHLKRFKDGDKMVDIWTNPNMVRTAGGVKGGELQLAGASTRIDRKPVASAVGVGVYRLPGEVVKLFMNPQLIPPVSNRGEAAKAPWVNPFWIVGTTTKQEKVNVKLSWIDYTVREYTIPMPLLTATKAIKPNVQLLRMASKEPPVPPQKGAPSIPPPKVSPPEPKVPPPGPKEAPPEPKGAPPKAPSLLNFLQQPAAKPAAKPAGRPPRAAVPKPPPAKRRKA